MKVKSYFAHTVEDAMALASQELGADAMLLNSRKAPPEARHLGDYEVVFASAPGGFPAPVPPGSAPPPLPAANERLSEDVAALKKELEGMRRALSRSMAPSKLAGAEPDLADAYALLTNSDVSADLAREIVQGVEARSARSRAASRKSASAVERYLREEMESRFSVRAALGRGESGCRTAALVGPPGAGKTTTLVKLAVNYGLASRRPVLLLSTDTYRVAAAEQLRCYAAILGVGFQLLETVAALAQAIEENRGKDLILIDTPGFAPQDMDSAAPLARFLSTRADIDTHLVLPSTMKPADLSRTIDAFQDFAPQCLLFTRLDETGSCGPVFNEAVRTGKPLSFFACGQRIPEDLVAAGQSSLLDWILTGKPVEALHAA